MCGGPQSACVGDMLDVSIIVEKGRLVQKMSPSPLACPFGCVLLSQR